MAGKIQRVNGNWKKRGVSKNNEIEVNEREKTLELDKTHTQTTKLHLEITK